MKALPSFLEFNDVVSVLNLPISLSELHGLLCGYLCAGEVIAGEQYIRALFTESSNKMRAAATMLYDVYAYSQQQFEALDFSLQLMLPDDFESLPVRAEAFANWCEGFAQGMTLSGIGFEQLKEDETRDALLHITEFAQMDFEKIEAESSEDDQSLMEVSEYTRMAVLRIYMDLNAQKTGGSTATH